MNNVVRLHKQQAFSLLECLIVIALLGLVLGLSYSSGLFLSPLLMRIETERLAAVCRYLQGHALASGVKQKLFINQHANSYSYHTKVHSLGFGIAFDIFPDAQHPPSGISEHIKGPITFKNQTIEFDEDGSISPGALYLVDRNRQHCYALTSGVGASSYVHVYSYRNGQWQRIT